MPWCVVWRQPQKRRGCRQPETNTCTPLLCTYVRVSMWMCLSVCGNVFISSATKKGMCVFLQLRANYVTCVCLYSLQVFVLMVGGVGDAQVHWEWAENAAWGSTLCSTQKQRHWPCVSVCVCVCVSMYSKISCVLGWGERINYRLSFCSANLNVCLQRKSESNSIKRKWRETANRGRILTSSLIRVHFDYSYIYWLLNRSVCLSKSSLVLAS